MFSSEPLTNNTKFEGRKVVQTLTGMYVPIVSKVSVRLEISCLEAIVRLLILDRDLRAEVLMQSENVRCRQMGAGNMTLTAVFEFKVAV